jgi:hypothetical protein
MPVWRLVPDLLNKLQASAVKSIYFFKALQKLRLPQLLSFNYFRLRFSFKLFEPQKFLFANLFELIFL